MKNIIHGGILLNPKQSTNVANAVINTLNGKVNVIVAEHGTV